MVPRHSALVLRLALLRSKADDFCHQHRVSGAFLLFNRSRHVLPSDGLDSRSFDNERVHTFHAVHDVKNELTMQPNTVSGALELQAVAFHLRLRQCTRVLLPLPQIEIIRLKSCYAPGTQ